MPDRSDQDLLDQLHRYGDALEGRVATVSAATAMTTEPPAGMAERARRARWRWRVVAGAAAVLVVLVAFSAVTGGGGPLRWLTGDIGDELVGRTFAVDSVSVGGGAAEPAEGSLQFGDGFVTIDDGCNDGSGSFVIERGRLEVRGAAMTAMNCSDDDPSTPEPTSWTGVLVSAAVSLDGDVLTLSDDRTTVVLVDAARPRGDALRDALIGRSFRSTTVLDAGDDRPILAEDGSPGGRLTLSFSDHDVTWFAGCNWSSASFEVDGDRLELGDEVTTTLRACLDVLSSQDSWWWRAVNMRPMIWLDGDILTLLAGDQARVELVDESTLPDELPPNIPTVADLEGREFWSSAIAEDGSARRILGPAFGPGQLTLRFRGGNVTVGAGCNSGTDPIRIDDGRLVGLAISTEVACEPQLIEQDDWLNGFFASSPTIRLVGTRLYLRSDTAVIELADRTEPLVTVSTTTAAPAPNETGEPTD